MLSSKISFLRTLCAASLISITVGASADENCQFSQRNLSYSLERSDMGFTLESIKKKKKYSVYSLVTQVEESSLSGKEKLQYQFDFYQSHQIDSKEAAPLIVLFPTINGVGFLDKKLARYLSKRGFHVLIPYARSEKLSDQQDVAFHIDLELARAICGVELVIDHKQQIFSFDMHGLAVVGASQGGIRGTTLFNRRPEADALVTSVAASNLPRIYAQSTQQIIEKLRFRLLSLLGLSNPPELESYLASSLMIDPAFEADPNRAHSIRMLISIDDSIVPTSTQLELWEIMGRPQRQLLNSGHGASVLRMHLQRSKILSFIRSKLSQKSVSETL